MAKIVVVDDDRAGCLILAAALQAGGHRVSSAYDAMGGFSVVMRECPDLLVLDLLMPAGGGFSVADRMRHIPKLATTRIIVITATDDPANRTRATEIGAAAFLLKPVDGQTLRQAVDDVLRRSE